MSIKNLIINNKFNFLLISLWTVIVIFTAFHHEVWYDEIISYCYVKFIDFPFIFDVLKGQEGHPVLWYLLEYPFAKAGCPIYAIQIIAFIFMFIAICYFCLKTKINIFAKSLLIFSSGMLYLLPVIARNYSLIPIFIFILADIYPKRHYPFLSVIYAVVIVLLSQTHIMVWGFCLICSILFLIEFVSSVFKQEKRKNTNWKYKLGNISASFILLIDFILTFNFFKSFILNYNFYKISSFDFAKTLSLTKENIWNYVSYIPINIGMPDLIVNIFIFILFFLLLSLFFINKKSLLIFLVSAFSVEYLFINIYPLQGVYSQKLFIPFLFLIFSCSILTKKDIIIWKIKELTLSLLLIILFFYPFSYLVIKDEIENYFSTMPKLVDFLKNNLNENDKIFLIGSIGYYYHCFFEFPNTYTNNMIELPITDFSETLTNEYIDKYMIDKKLKIKYLIIPDGIKTNFKPPYKKITEYPKNKISVIKVLFPNEDNYNIYEINQL